MSRSLLPALLLSVALLTGRAGDRLPELQGGGPAQPSEVASMARGYNYSVMFMVSMPFLLLGTGGLMVARAVKRGALPEW